MLPDLYWTAIQLGPVSIQVWGLFVALGIIAALLAAKRLADARGLDGQLIIDAGFWIILFGVLGARLLYIVTEWQVFADDVFAVVKVWEGGMSIMGSIIGGVIAGYIYLRKRVGKQWLQYIEYIVWALPLGLAIGRLGCFFVFDHPGSVTTFFLGEVYHVDGLVRHNHGLYLAINGAVMFLVFWLIEKYVKPALLTYIPLFLVWYGAYRFIMDFDRISDRAYAMLTPAQWIGLTMIAAGAILWFNRKKFFSTK